MFLVHQCILMGFSFPPVFADIWVSSSFRVQIIRHTRRNSYWFLRLFFFLFILFYFFKFMVVLKYEMWPDSQSWRSYPRSYLYAEIIFCLKYYDINTTWSRFELFVCLHELHFYSRTLYAKCCIFLRPKTSILYRGKVLVSQNLLVFPALLRHVVSPYKPV